MKVKRTVLGGIVSVLLIVTAILVMYLFVARTTSSFRIREFDNTVAFMSDRIDALEKQRDLLKSSAAAVEKEMAVLNKRVRQIDVEIQSMKDLVGSAKTSIRYPFFRWDRLRITAGGSVVMIAFLVLIWLLYRAFIKDGASPECKDDEALPLPDAGEGAEAHPGSVLEEEYPLPSSDGETETPEDESHDEDDGSAEEAGEVLGATDPDSLPSEEEPGEEKE